MPAVFFDLNALVPNLKGAFQEGVSAAFRTVDITLDEDMSLRALGKSYSEGVRAIYKEELGISLPNEVRVGQLSGMYANVVHRFVQFSSSFFVSPLTAAIVEGLRIAGFQVGIITDLDAKTFDCLMGRLGWNPTDLFDTVVTSSDAKHKDAMLALLIGRFELPTSGLRIFVGALAQDALPAHLHGCDRIFIRDLEQPSEDARKEKVKFETFHSMTDLAEMLRPQSLEAMH